MVYNVPNPAPHDEYAPTHISTYLLVCLYIHTRVYVCIYMYMYIYFLYVLDDIADVCMYDIMYHDFPCHHLHMTYNIIPI